MDYPSPGALGSFDVRPVPFSDRLEVLTPVADACVEVLDLSGRVLWSGRAVAGRACWRPPPETPNGVYVVRCGKLVKWVPLAR